MTVTDPDRMSPGQLRMLADRLANKGYHALAREARNRAARRELGIERPDGKRQLGTRDG